MSEIKTPLISLAPGESFTAGDDCAHVISSEHSHADILRYVVGDIGDDALPILDRILIEGRG